MSAGKEDILLEQNYGDQSESGALQLLPGFFSTQNTFVQGKPVFAIYRITGKKLRPMVTLWKKMAVKSGLQGLHIVDSINQFYLASIDEPFSVSGVVDASYHFILGRAASMENLPSMSGLTKSSIGVPPCFDRRPRSVTMITLYPKFS